MIILDPDELAAFYYKGRRNEMVEFLMTRRNFSRDGATKAVDNFIDTQVFVARETGKVTLVS